jgi:Uri superfamily endonuclease
MPEEIEEAHVRSMLPAKGGTYILVLKVTKPSTISVGRKGSLRLAPGHYLYVGSAFGQGGLRARVGRHAQEQKALRWHIDYLREVSQLIGVYFCTEASRLEDDWAVHMASWPGLSIPMQGFGSTDTHVPSHLFYCRSEPDLTLFAGLPGKPGQFLHPEC